jgi:hypothetical protein
MSAYAAYTYTCINLSYSGSSVSWEEDATDRSTLNIYLQDSAPYVAMLTFNKKFWVELIAYFLFATICISDTSSQ